MGQGYPYPPDPCTFPCQMIWPAANTGCKNNKKHTKNAPFETAQNTYRRAKAPSPKKKGEQCKMRSPPVPPFFHFMAFGIRRIKSKLIC